MSHSVKPVAFRRIAARWWKERPVAGARCGGAISIEFNGIGYAVMMASPADLEDFAVGFALAERLVEDAGEILAIDHHVSTPGRILRIALAESWAETSLGRVRHRVSDASCGLCGIENLEQALRPLPSVAATSSADDMAQVEHRF